VKPTKILYLIDSLGVGGTERQLALSVAALDQRSIQSYVCYLHPPSDLERCFTNQGVPVYNLQVSGKWQWGSGILKLRRLVKSLGIDLIHTQLFNSDVIGGLVGRLSGVPVVSTLATSCYEREWLIDNPGTNRWKLAQSKMIRRLIAQRCNQHIIAVSEYVKGSAMRQLRISPEKASVIHRALSPQWFEADSSPQSLEVLESNLGLNDTHPVLLNTGRLIPAKGQRYLIEAMPAILRELPKARLLIAGDGPLLSDLTGLCNRLGVKEHVLLLGQRDDVRALFEISDIFVFTSLYEGCPNALLEALSLGKPCVATQIPAVEEIVQHGQHGILVPPQSPQAIAAAVVKLVGNAQRAREMAVSAQQIARDRFTLPKVVEAMERVYTSVLAESRTQRMPARSRSL
jgi:glycosyltransferase involved in cell wall biosynthesis